MQALIKELSKVTEYADNQKVVNLLGSSRMTLALGEGPFQRVKGGLLIDVGT